MVKDQTQEKQRHPLETPGWKVKQHKAKQQEYKKEKIKECLYKNDKIIVHILSKAKKGKSLKEIEDILKRYFKKWKYKIQWADV